MNLYGKCRMKRADKSMVVVAGIVILIRTCSVLAQDWPQWRGPNRDGKLSGFTAPPNWP